MEAGQLSSLVPEWRKQSGAIKAMSEPSDVHTLVAQVSYNRGYDGLDGLDPIRRLLWNDADGSVAALLEAELPLVPTKVKGGIAYLLAGRYFELGSVQSIALLVSMGDAEIAAAALGALTADPGDNRELAAATVDMAVAGCEHMDGAVRAAACSVLMNLGAWGVDISAGVGHVGKLLVDPDAFVRQSAVYAIGNFAKIKRCPLAAQVAGVTQLLSDGSIHVRTAACWALWKLSRTHDISEAIPALFEILASTDPYDSARKHASGALLSFARKSQENMQNVRQTAVALVLNLETKEIVRFKTQLTAIKSQ